MNGTHKKAPRSWVMQTSASPLWERPGPKEGVSIVTLGLGVDPLRKKGDYLLYRCLNATLQDAFQRVPLTRAIHCATLVLLLEETTPGCPRLARGYNRRRGAPTDPPSPESIVVESLLRGNGRPFKSFVRS